MSKRNSKELLPNNIENKDSNSLVDEMEGEQADMIQNDVSVIDEVPGAQGTHVVKVNVPVEEEKKVGLNDIFNNLENMSNTSTLFDGIDDEPPVNLGQVASRQPSTEHPHDQSQQKPNMSGKKSSEVDPFDMKNFQNVSDSYLGAPDDYIAQTRTLKLPNRDRIYDPKNEIAKLKEELRIRQSEIERMSIQLNQFQSKNMNMSFEIANSTSTYHLSFMFASPLVRRLNSTIEMIMQLDYINEIKNIEKSLKGVKHEIKYRVDVATINNFRSVVTDAPFALHFTGHGIRNDPKALGSAYEQYKNRGNILLLEDETGMAEYLFENDLKRLVELSKANREFSHNYEVVFVSSCYSEFAGNIFLSSGARHVICIEKDQRISDRASLRFSKVFYETVFVKKYSVCKAFEIAKDDIRTLINHSEASKFMLLVYDNLVAPSKGEGKKHKCFPIAEFTDGTLTKIGSNPMFDSVPAPIENFMGRQQEM